MYTNTREIKSKQYFLDLVLDNNSHKDDINTVMNVVSIVDNIFKNTNKMSIKEFMHEYNKASYSHKYRVYV